MKMTAVYRGSACARAVAGSLPVFYVIPPESHRFPASETRTVGVESGESAFRLNTFCL